MTLISEWFPSHRGHALSLRRRASGGYDVHDKTCDRRYVFSDDAPSDVQVREVLLPDGDEAAHEDLRPVRRGEPPREPEVRRADVKRLVAKFVFLTLATVVFDVVWQLVVDADDPV